MIDLRLWELFGYPMLAAGFAAHWGGWRRALQVWIGATVIAFAGTWALSAPGSANRLRIEELAGSLGWALAAGAPVLGYALLIRWARRKAREREE